MPKRAKVSILAPLRDWLLCVIGSFACRTLLTRMGRIDWTMVSAILWHQSAERVLNSPGGWTEELSLAERTGVRTPDADRHQSMMDNELASPHGYCGVPAFAVGLVWYGPALPAGGPLQFASDGGGVRALASGSAGPAMPGPPNL